MKEVLEFIYYSTTTEYSISGLVTIQFGIPQSTAIGPIIFTLYSNVLLNLLIHAYIIDFADYMIIYYQDINWNTKELNV